MPKKGMPRVIISVDIVIKDAFREDLMLSIAPPSR
jgi:hypothetical protein